LSKGQVFGKSSKTIPVVNISIEELKGLHLQPLRFGNQLFLNEMELELLSDCFDTQADNGE
jgi:hypothetical protein